jgi:CRISPR-associated protein Cmr2
LYAGGDDVLAALPPRGAMAAARELRDLYRSPFVVRAADGAVRTCGGVVRPAAGETLLAHPGGAATMSAAVLFWPEGPPGDQVEEARRLVDDEAKERAGRDAVAVAVRGPSGAARVAARKWDDEPRGEAAAIEGFLAQVGRD